MTKAFMTGSFPVRTLASMDSLVDTLLQMLIYDLGDDYISGYSDKVNSVTKEQVDAAVKKYIKPESFSSVIVGPDYQ